MSEEKGKISKENRRHLKDEIQSLLETIKTEPQNNLVIDEEVSNEIKRESPYDFDQMSSQFTKKARDITDSLYKNFVDVGIFEKNDYHKYKKELDTINISNLFFQLKTLKITIMKIMEEITSGNMNSRLIEVMGQLQDKFSAITKMQANYIMFLEDTYKKLNAAPSVNPLSAELSSSPTEGQFFVTVGTKNVIKNLPTSNGVGSHHRKGDAENTGRLVDPSAKSELMREQNIDPGADDLGDEFIDLTEII